MKAMTVTIFTSFFLITRTFYNLLAININNKLPDFGFDWINVSDQVSFSSFFFFSYLFLFDN